MLYRALGLIVTKKSTKGNPNKFQTPKPKWHCRAGSTVTRRFPKIITYAKYNKTVSSHSFTVASWFPTHSKYNPTFCCLSEAKRKSQKNTFRSDAPYQQELAALIARLPLIPAGPKEEHTDSAGADNGHSSPPPAVVVATTT